MDRDRDNIIPLAVFRREDGTIGFGTVAPSSDSSVSPSNPAPIIPYAPPPSIPAESVVPALAESIISHLLPHQQQQQLRTQNVTHLQRIEHYLQTLDNTTQVAGTCNWLFIISIIILLASNGVTLYLLVTDEC